ncbi:MAG: hypothetical protein ACOH18_03760 [Candidatus Saccharimonadaceae bacterium]
MKNISIMHRQSGAVSLFVVIFAILLMSVVTVGFLRIMTNDQNKATGNDLAQSAYDSSQAGVEDAKRALLWYTQKCTMGTIDPGCASFVTRSNECNGSISVAQVVKAGDFAPKAGGAGTGEIKVQQSTSNTDKALDQAYTCVTLQLDTDDYIGTLTANQSVVIPLVTTTLFDPSVNTITIEWFDRDDVSNTTGAVATPTPVSSQQLVTPWPPNRPSIMRTQFMQVGSNFKLADFDSTTASSQSNANTVFLYPATNGFTSATMVDRDTRMSPAGVSIADTAGSTPLPSKCSTSVSSGTYACKITLNPPVPVGGGKTATGYLRLTAMNAGSHYRVTLNGVKFRNVQPIVDATGRANEVFRRVQSRIDLYDGVYPDAALDVSGNLCKDFGVTDTLYIAGTCDPNL